MTGLYLGRREAVVAAVEEEEDSFRADAVNAEDSERDRATLV